MRDFLRSRRGSVAFATVVALVPAIGFLALGAEAGSWYVTKQQAQNAADAAAYSGALNVACKLSPSSCQDTKTYDYRAKQFAAQNAFCNSGDSGYVGSRCGTLATGISRTVVVASLTSWKGAAGTYVQATMTQQQPAYLAQLLGFSTVNIAATAVAAVKGAVEPPCALSLTGSISFQGSPNISAPNCGLATDSTATNALDFTGGGMTLNLGSLSASGGCSGAASFCNSALTYMPPITNPFAALDSVTLPSLSNCTGSLTAYSAATPCKNNNLTLTGNTDITLAGGVYFISGQLQIKGNGSILGTALFVMLPGSSFSMKGGGTINITGNTSVASSQVPAALQPYTSLLAGMALYYQSSNAVTIGGGSQITFGGNLYLPNAAVTFQGNPTITLNGQKCGQLVAASIAFNGNATFEGNQCGSSTSLAAVRYVALVP